MYILKYKIQLGCGVFFSCSKLFKTKQFNLILIFALANLKPQIIIIVCQFTVNNKL